PAKRGRRTEYHPPPPPGPTHRAGKTPPATIIDTEQPGRTWRTHESQRAAPQQHVRHGTPLLANLPPPAQASPASPVPDRAPQATRALGPARPLHPCTAAPREWHLQAPLS